MSLSVLEAASKLLVQGEDEKALEVLVEGWREGRATALAELIDQFAARLSSKLPPVNGAGATSDRQAWLQVAEDQRQATLPRLFEVLPRTTGPHAAERIEALAQWPVSPLISSALAKWFEHPPFDGKARGRCFPRALEILEAHRDPRTVAVLKKLAEPANRSKTIRVLGLSSWKPLRALVKRAEDWAPAPTPSAAELAMLQSLRARFAPAAVAKPAVSLEAFYAAVYAQPEDETARLILADVLQEAGDPRGEFIALQLARAAAGGRPSKREKELVETWGRDWLGALNPALMRQGIVFERGFLAHCSYNGDPSVQLVERPEWATVTHLEVAHAAKYVARAQDEIFGDGMGERAEPQPMGGTRRLLLGPALKALRHVSGVGSQVDLRAITEAGWPLPWESLSLRLWSLDHATQALCANAPLPSLTRLGLFADYPTPLRGLDEDEVARILQGPLGRSLRHLELGMSPPMFGMMIDFAGTKGLTSIAIHPTSRELSLRFDVASRSVVIDFEPHTIEGMEAIVSAMRSVRRGTVDRVLLNAGSRAKVSGGALVAGSRKIPLRALKDAVGKEVELVLPG
jgi:uncharacterized protein (TIGR02996 family)